MPAFKPALLLSICGLVAMSGCTGAGPWPPKPTVLQIKTDSGLHCTFLKWRQGLSVLVVDHLGEGGIRVLDVKDSVDGVYIWSATVTSPLLGVKHVNWTLETSDGSSGRLVIDGEQYDLSAGEVISIDAENGGPKIRQFNRSLSALPSEAEAVKEFLLEDMTK